MRWLRIGTLTMLSGLILSTASADEDRFTVKAEIPELEVASQDEVVIHLESADGYKIDMKSQISLDFVPRVSTETIAVRKQRLKKEDADIDADGKKMSWDIDVTAKKKGDHKVDVKLNASVCDKHACHPVKYNMVLTITVKGA